MFSTVSLLPLNCFLRLAVKGNKWFAWHLDNERKSRQNKTDVTWPDLTTCWNSWWLFSQHGISCFISSNADEVQQSSTWYPRKPIPSIQQQLQQKQPSLCHSFTVKKIKNVLAYEQLWASYPHCHRVFCFHIHSAGDHALDNTTVLYYCPPVWQTVPEKFRHNLFYQSLQLF